MNQKNRQVSRVALVTGSARRIGAAIAEVLHHAGFNVVIHFRHSQDEAEALVRSLNEKRAHSAVCYRADLSLHSDAEQLVKQSVEWQNRLDVLVNNVSLFVRTPIQHLHETAWDEMWTLNVKAPFWLSEAAYPFLEKQEGVILNLTDIHAEKPLRDYGLYCQTKAALKMQTEMLAKEYAPKVRVNAVAPGSIVWPEGKNALSCTQKDAIIAKTPLNRHGSPKWIADAALSLIENQFITGQTLRVDGGRMI